MSQLISNKYAAYKTECNARFDQLKANEEELNRIFIDIYGLQDELTPEVADKDVTVHRIYDSKDDVPESMKGSNYVRTLRDEIVSLISYAVGCLLGRYSLDVEGLAYAGGDFSKQWVGISGPSSNLSPVTTYYYRHEVIEYYIVRELSRVFDLATDTDKGITCVIGANTAGGSIRLGTITELYKGIRPFSNHSDGVQWGGVTDPVYDLCSPEILNAIANGNGNELISRGWQDADRIDWQAIRSSLAANHYSPCHDNIVPIGDDDYFDNDITARFVQWVAMVYGEETLEENLKFIADALGGKGTAREVIRRYFLSDFYTDHCKTYQKRPIYWLFDSGKKNGFKALIYMHRYQSDLLAQMRTDYIHEQQERYRTRLTHLDDALLHAEPSQRVKLAKEQKKLQEQAAELQQYEEKIHHLADQNITIDLDDGVKHNYALFGDVLAKIK